jgi:hypothetical protein
VAACWTARHRRRALGAVAAIAAVPIVAIGGGASADPIGRTADDPEGSAATTVDSVANAVDARCVVRLHGKGGSGGETTVDAAGVRTILPTGNAEGWGGRQWLYFPDDEYEAARAIVVDAVADCDVVILDGFSNGASFAAKLYCRAETFDGRLLRVVVDDPVPDAGTADCTPDPGVEVVLYWTGALEATARPGWDCGDGDWTCEGGTTVGIAAYAEALGAEVRESPFADHEWYWDAPELDDWAPAASPPTATAASGSADAIARWPSVAPGRRSLGSREPPACSKRRAR